MGEGVYLGILAMVDASTLGTAQWGMGGWVGGWMDGWMEGWMGGWMDGRADGWMDG